MKALMFLSPGAPLTLEEVPIPPLQPDQLLVRIRSAGICGTDLHFYQHDELAKGKKLRYPYILGHEMAGEVIEVGKNVTRFAVGDRITHETHVPCGKCFYCLLGVGTLIEASGAPSALALGMRVMRKGGKAVLFGLGTKPAEIDVARWIVSKELTLVATLGRRMFDTWMRMETLVQKGVLNLDPVMGESFPLERFKQAFALALSGKNGKIFFAP